MKDFHWIYTDFKVQWQHTAWAHPLKPGEEIGYSPKQPIYALVKKSLYTMRMVSDPHVHLPDRVTSFMTEVA